jgi:vacuolar-type H+-ATPase subunit E/Vma4
MAIQDLKKYILDEAKKEADEMIRAAESEARKIKEEYKKAVEREKEMILREARSKSEEKKRGIVIPARLKAKKDILEAKHKVLDEVFKGVASEMREKKEIEVIKALYG